MSKALLICNSPQIGPWLKKLARQADFVLAADGGANRAIAAGVIPDAVIGDLDSVCLRTRRLLKDIPFIKVSRQDNTDLEKALDWLVAQQFNSCMIVGATGGRLDFTLANMLAIRTYLKKIALELKGQNWTLCLLTQGKKFTARKGARCSFIVLSPCKKVTLKGLKYTAIDENWPAEYTGRTLSNEISAAKSEISFASGELFMYLEN